MQTRSRGAVALTGLAVFALVATACGGSEGSSPGPTSSTAAGKHAFIKYATNGGGTPAKGGVLNVLGTTDTDYLDSNLTYYTIGSMFMHQTIRPLYGYQAIPGKQTEVVPDLATAAPEISSDGLTYKVTIRDGVNWNTSPARQVTAEDAVRGIKVACNPAQPMGGLPDFDYLIKGYKAFCEGFQKVQPNAAAIKKYLEGEDVAGLQADGQTITYTLTQAAPFFASQLAMPTFAPRPIEYDAYVPASAQAAQHTLSDGPYQIQSYNPAHKIVWVRNDGWDPDTDPIRKAYVDKIILTMTDDPTTGLQQLQTNTASADLAEFSVEAAQVPSLLAADDPNLNVEPTISSNPFLWYNTQSPNNKGALKDLKVRQALSYAINRANIIQDLGGPKLNPPLTHVIPEELLGAPKDFDPYPHNVAKAKEMLQAAGVKNMTLKYLYRPSSPTQTKIFQTLQNDLKAVGIKVTPVQSPDADFYTKYLQVQSAAKKGLWDIAGAGWGPDWYGNAALSFFAPLFIKDAFPPSGSNYGLIDDTDINTCVEEAKAAKTQEESLAKWGECDKVVMEKAPFFPVTDPNDAQYHASQVHNFVYMPQYQTADFCNVWLDPGKQGG